MYETELENGKTIPVRTIGTQYVIAYDHIEKCDFLSYMEELLGNEETKSLEEDEVHWCLAVDVKFEEGPRLVLTEDYSNYDAFPVTVFRRW